eukprot:TRINITY_DN11413_c0_g1_i1.p1 TRINITY_DN11413_c0_g1~~TRINITY_DN11413_c0_g1_i1.p1  ORF type:complete len:498 (-),score=73.28 TRINITY_DN11413_c0_g1_i1:189-1682(-)
MPSLNLADCKARSPRQEESPRWEGQNRGPAQTEAVSSSPKASGPPKSPRRAEHAAAGYAPVGRTSSWPSPPLPGRHTNARARLRMRLSDQNQYKDWWRERDPDGEDGSEEEYDAGQQGQEVTPFQLPCTPFVVVQPAPGEIPQRVLAAGYEHSECGGGSYTARDSVFLNVYDLRNPLLRASGAFHAGVEVYGKEWCYGYTPPEIVSKHGVLSGISYVPPRQHPDHTYRVTVPLGATALSRTHVILLIRRLMKEWPGYDYSVFRRNCLTFCEEFCRELGVDEMPSWVDSSAKAAGAVDRQVRSGIRSLREAVLQVVTLRPLTAMSDGCSGREGHTDSPKMRNHPPEWARRSSCEEDELAVASTALPSAAASGGSSSSSGASDSSSLQSAESSRQQKAAPDSAAVEEGVLDWLWTPRRGSQLDSDWFTPRVFNQGASSPRGFTPRAARQESPSSSSQQRVTSLFKAWGNGCLGRTRRRDSDVERPWVRRPEDAGSKAQL